MADLALTEITTISDALTAEHKLTTPPTGLDSTYLETTYLSLVDHENHSVGVVAAFLEKQGDGTIPPAPFHKTLKADIQRRTNKEGIVSGFADMVKHRGLTRQQVQGMIDSVMSKGTQDDLVAILTGQLNAEPFDARRRLTIIGDARKYLAQRLDATNLIIDDARKAIKAELSGIPANAFTSPTVIADTITRLSALPRKELMDFHLELTNSKTREPQQATPAFLFLPFYFDQDRSWIDNWDSFENLQQFSSFRPAISQFHTGIKPNEYYKAKSRKTSAEHRLEETRTDRSVVNRVLEKIELLMKDAQFDISVKNYEQEITRLLHQCNELKKSEESLRDELVVMENRRVLIERQIQITESAASELSKDFTYASETLEDEIECPMCGTGYLNSFAERFGIAKDEDEMRGLLIQLNDEYEACMSDMQQKKDAATEANERLNQIAALLEVRQGEVRLQDVLRSEGKKEVRVVLRDELDVLNRKIGEIDDEIMAAEKDMKEFTTAKRTKEIKEYYQGRMSVHLQQLQVKELTEEGYKDVHSRIKENGSDGPRALLAFYFAIIKTMEKFSTSTLCPIVIDSPNQQDQDPENWRRILEFMRDQRPDGAQMIIGLVDDVGVDLGGEVIELTDERQLLQKDEYDDVAEELRPYIDKSLAY